MVFIPDIITYANFGDDRLRGLGLAGGQSLPFSIDFDRRPYNTHALPCECVMIGTTESVLWMQENRRRLKEEEELRKQRDRARKMAEFETWKNPPKANFVISKRTTAEDGVCVQIINYASIVLVVLLRFIMAALCNRGPLYFCPVISIFFFFFFFFFLFFPRLISAATDWISTILLHMAWP